jgi:hypothetical protein
LITIDAKGIAQIKGPMTQIKADAMVMIKGAVTLIN